MKRLSIIALVLLVGCTTTAIHQAQPSAEDMAEIEKRCLERELLNTEIRIMIQELEQDGVIIRDVIK